MIERTPLIPFPHPPVAVGPQDRRDLARRQIPERGIVPTGGKPLVEQDGDQAASLSAVSLAACFAAFGAFPAGASGTASRSAWKISPATFA